MAVSQERQEEIIKVIIGNFRNFNKKNRCHWRHDKDRLLQGAKLTWMEYYYLANENQPEFISKHNDCILQMMIQYAEICCCDVICDINGDNDEESENADLIPRIPCKALIKSGARKGLICNKINCAVKSHKIVEKLDFGE